MKKKFIDAHMEVAEIYSRLSSAKKLQVGAVLVKNDTIIGIGYNGTPSGWNNECEDKHYLTLPYLLDDDKGNLQLSSEYPFEDESGRYKLVTKPEVIHAEQNLLTKIAKSTNSSEGSIMFVTHAPCINCAKLIYQSGIHKVFYRNNYRIEEGLNFLFKCGVEIEKC